MSFNKNIKDQNTITIPCGQCIGCRLSISREWATRCMNEAQMHKHNCVITLTYNEEHLPPQSSLEYKDFQQFMRRLRKASYKAARAEGAAGRPGRLQSNLLFGDTIKARFYMGGEYGEQCANCGANKRKCKCGNWKEQIGRPHFHACLFGINFKDQIYNRTTEAKSKIYTSPTLDKLWNKGFASIGELTFESAAYIARYILKKQIGDKKQSYQIIDALTGEIQTRKKEFNQMSRKPGIGKSWSEKYKADIYPHGQCLVRGHKNNTPRYYDEQYKLTNEEEYAHMKYTRLQTAINQTSDHSDERLAVQEQVQMARIKSLKRGKI